MMFPLDLWDISLFLAATDIMLLIALELLSPYYKKVKIILDKQKLRNAAIVVSVLFLATVVVRIISLFVAP